MSPRRRPEPMPTTKTARPAPELGAPSTTAQASLYQQLRAHLAVLKLYDAAEHLPAVLDAAVAEGLSMTAALERLLAVAVDATDAAAMLDRLLHRSVVLNLDGDSYRLRAHHAANDTLRRTTTGTRQPLTLSLIHISEP